MHLNNRPVYVSHTDYQPIALSNILTSSSSSLFNNHIRPSKANPHNSVILIEVGWLKVNTTPYIITPIYATAFRKQVPTVLHSTARNVLFNVSVILISVSTGDKEYNTTLVLDRLLGFFFIVFLFSDAQWLRCRWWSTWVNAIQRQLRWLSCLATSPVHNPRPKSPGGDTAVFWTHPSTNRYQPICFLYKSIIQ